MKKLLALSLALVMAFAATACGNQASTGDTIKIGGITPLTSNVSVYGIAVNNGVKIAVDEINAAGGIMGKQIEYIAVDDKGDPTEAVNAYQKLVVKDKVVGIVGAVTSKPSLAVAQASVTDNMPIITGTATAADVTTTGTNVFRTCFIDPFQGELMANYAAKEMGAKTAAVLYNRSDDYSSGVAEAFIAQAKAEGITIVAEETFQTDDADFKNQLTTIKGKTPDVLMLPVYAQDLRVIGAQIKEIGVTAKLMGVDGWDGVLADENFDASAINGGVFCSQYSPESTDEALQKFISTYKEKFKEDPNMFAVLGYDSMQILAKAINTANSTDKDAIIKAMNETNYAGLTGNITFDENRNPVKSSVIMSVQDGAYKYVKNFEMK